MAQARQRLANQPRDLVVDAVDCAAQVEHLYATARVEEPTDQRRADPSAAAKRKSRQGRESVGFHTTEQSAKRKRRRGPAAERASGRETCENWRKRGIAPTRGRLPLVISSSRTSENARVRVHLGARSWHCLCARRRERVPPPDRSLNLWRFPKLVVLEEAELHTFVKVVAMHHLLCKPCVMKREPVRRERLRRLGVRLAPAVAARDAELEEKERIRARSKRADDLELQPARKVRQRASQTPQLVLAAHHLIELPPVERALDAAAERANRNHLLRVAELNGAEALCEWKQAIDPARLKRGNRKLVQLADEYSCLGDDIFWHFVRFRAL
jgi:hypothetical protein